MTNGGGMHDKGKAKRKAKKRNGKAAARYKGPKSLLTKKVANAVQ